MQPHVRSIQEVLGPLENVGVGKGVSGAKTAVAPPMTRQWPVSRATSVVSRLRGHF